MRLTIRSFHFPHISEYETKISRLENHIFRNNFSSAPFQHPTLYLRRSQGGVDAPA